MTELVDSCASCTAEEERGDWTLIGRGSGIHGPRLDEDISVEGLIAGRPSGERAESLQNWLASRD